MQLSRIVERLAQRGDVGGGDCAARSVTGIGG